MDWTPLVEDLPREHAFEPLELEGRLPDGLSGTLLRVGPGLFEPFGRRYGHLFDGDGALSAVRFSQGRAYGCARVVENRGLLAERQAGKPLYYAFGTPRSGFPRSLRPKNAANTSVLYWDDRLFALFEAGLPTEFRCDDDLRTVGENNLGGVVRGTFSAHPHYAPSRAAMYNFGLRVRPWGSSVDLYELKDAGGARRIGNVPMPGAAFMHDFIVTGRHAVFFNSPLRVSCWRYFLRSKSLAENLVWRSQEGVSVVVVPLDEPEKAFRFETEPFMQLHFANAFERPGEIVVDFVRYPGFEDVMRLTNQLMRREALAPPLSRLCRARIDLARRRMSCEESWSRDCEFPVVAGRGQTADCGHVYLVAAAPGDDTNFSTRLVKFSAATGKAAEFEFGSRCYPSEAMFVPRPGGVAEDEGYLLSLVFDAARGASFMAVLDARDIERGALAKAWFDHRVPMTFHGAWRPD